MFDDYSKYSMEQLIERQDKLYMRLNIATHSGSSGLIDSVLRLLGVIEEEIKFRSAIEVSRAIIDASPSIIETDPDLAVEHKKEVAKQETVDVIPEQRRVPTRRSARPLKPDDLN